jgi:hypothetical protein
VSTDLEMFHQAHCSCGWVGPERVSHESALRDVDDHVRATGHAPPEGL